MPRYGMGTIAIHGLGNISRDIPSLFRITDETDVAFIGHWVEGLGFVEVVFPKQTSYEIPAWLANLANEHLNKHLVID